MEWESNCGTMGFGTLFEIRGQIVDLRLLIISLKDLLSTGY